MNAMEGALQTFRERMESSLPLRHFTEAEFHEESRFEEVSLQERAGILVEFMPNVASRRSSCVIPDLVQKLISKIEEVIENLRKKMTESVMETFINAHCSRYKISMEAQLSLNPGLGREQREFLFETNKSMMVRSFESEWLLSIMNTEFRLEQKAKLEIKLDLNRKQIQGNQTGLPSSSGGNNGETVEAQVPNAEFEMTTSSSQYELESQNKGNGEYPDFTENDAFSIWNWPSAGPAEGSRAMSDVPLDFSMDGHGQSVDESGEIQVVEGFQFDDNEIVKVEVEVQPSDLINDDDETLPQSSLQEDRDRYPGVVVHPGYSEFVNSDCSMFQCRFCKKTFKTKAYLKNHELCCIKDDVMRHRCNKGGEYLSHYESHLQSDTDGRPFVCQVCYKSFAKNGTLLRHMNIHTEKNSNARLGSMIAQKSFPTLPKLEHLSVSSWPSQYDSLIAGVLIQNMNLKSVFLDDWDLFSKNNAIPPCVWDVLGNLRLKNFGFCYNYLSPHFKDAFQRLGQFDWPLECRSVYDRNWTVEPAEVGASIIFTVLSRFNDTLEEFELETTERRLVNDRTRLVVDFPKLKEFDLPMIQN